MWRDEWDRIAQIVAASSIAGLAVGAVRIAVSYRYDGRWQWFAVMCGTVFVAVLAALVVADSDLSPAWGGAVVGVAAFVADNIILAMLTLAKSIGTDPIRTLRRLAAAWRGKAVPPDTDKTPLDDKGGAT